MLRKERIPVLKILGISVAAVTGLITVMGMIQFDIFLPLLPERLIPGTMSQNILVLVSAVLLIPLALRLDKQKPVELMFFIALLMMIWYSHGILLIDRVMTVYFAGYALIFGLSFYTMFIAFMSIKQEGINLKLSKGLRYTLIGLFMINVLLFAVMWLSDIYSNIQTGSMPDTVSVYIMDLGFMLPLLVITSVLLAKKSGMGSLLAGVLIIKIITLFLSVFLGGLLFPVYDMEMISSELLIYGGMSGLFILLLIWYLIGLQKGDELSRS